MSNSWGKGLEVRSWRPFVQRSCSTIVGPDGIPASLLVAKDKIYPVVKILRDVVAFERTLHLYHKVRWAVSPRR